MAKNHEEKIQIIETLVQKDLGNGKHAQKKLSKMLDRSGKCPKDFCQELLKLKISR